jgi:hypothetical protein
VIDVYKFFCVINYSMIEGAVMAAPLHPEHFTATFHLDHTLLKLAWWQVYTVE